MQIEDYISSGILEAFVTGSLTPEEMREVEAMAAAHPEVRRELDAIELALENYGMAHAKKPGDHVLKGILSAVEQKAPVEETKVKRLFPYKTLSVAASILLLISLGLNVLYFNKAKNASAELSEIQAQNLQLAQQRDATQVGYDKIAAEMAILQDPNAVTITLKGLPDHALASAVVCWNKSNGQVHLMNTNLPEPPSDKQYQLWALIDGQPVSAGVFSSDKGLQVMKTFETVNAFAVTLEPLGGKESPTLDQMYVFAGV